MLEIVVINERFIYKFNKSQLVSIFLKKSILVNGLLRNDISSNEIVGVSALLFLLQCVH